MAVFMLVAAVGVAWLTGTPKIVVVMVGFSIFIASFAMGVGGTGWLLQGEVFPTAVRGRAAANCAAVNWIANFAIIEAFPMLQSGIGLPWVMVMLSALSLLAIGVHLQVPPGDEGSVGGRGGFPVRGTGERSTRAASAASGLDRRAGPDPARRSQEPLVSRPC